MTHELHQARALDLSGARALFTSTAHGNLALHVGDDPAVVRANRAALERAVGRPVVYVNQVHSARVTVIETREQLAAQQAAPDSSDALVTNRADIALAMMVADCVPVVFADAVGGVVGAAHAGRRGLLDGVLDVTVETMCALGATKADIQAVVGPSVCGDCYEVPAEMREESVALVPEVAATTSWGTPALDLRAGAVAVLVRGGIPAANVQRFDACTMETPDLYSYRNDSATGRFAGVIWRE